MASLIFRLDSQDYEIELFPHKSPKTLGKLLATLPANLDIHCAKIAGQHIFWHAPFVSDLEQAQDILALPAGTFLYWPERQFLELIYGELQAEKAQVCVLGQLKGDIGWLKDYGAKVIRQHGTKILHARLLEGEGCDGLVTAPSIQPAPELAWLREERKKIWQEPPAELFTLMKRRGLMLPYGPLAMAEGELRKLHELLWHLRATHCNIDTLTRGQIVPFLITAFNARIDGFCGLSQCGHVLEKAANLFCNPALQEEVLEELVLILGRTAAWLDAYIPWYALNETCLASLKGQGIGE